MIDARFEKDSKQLIPTANGFVFDAATTVHFIKTIQRALSLFSQTKLWNQLQRTAMQQDYGWEKSADEYIQLYRNET